MDSLKSIIFDIRNIARNGGSIDDEKLSYKQIKEWVNQYRALLIRRDIDKGKSFSDNIGQTLGCMKMIPVDKAECCNVESNCTILRTELMLPRPLEFSQMDAITYVGNIDRTRGYELSSMVGSHWDKYNKYTANVPKAILWNQYIYITNEEFLQYINVQGIFEDPTEASNFNSCDGNPCYTDNMAYPISAYMLPTLKQMILQQELNVSLSTKADTVNDGNGNIVQPQGQ